MLLFQAIVERLETEEQIKTAEQIFLNYRNAMFQIAYQILNNTHDAEEVVGDTIIKICKHIDDFTTKSEVERKLLVKKYTERTAIDLLRQNTRTETVFYNEAVFSDSDIESKDSEEGDVIFAGEEFGSLQKYVVKLPKKYRDILLLKYVNELRNKEIAALWHIPESTVSTQLVRAKNILKKLMNEGENNKDGSTQKR